MLSERILTRQLTTVHSSQATTADRVLIDAFSKSRTTAKDVYYVVISRTIFTDDAKALPVAIARENVKHAAPDLVPERRARPPQRDPEISMGER